MKSLTFLFFIAVLTISGGHARGPAVEDFVGIENQEPDVTPEGTQALFNFQEEVETFKQEGPRPAAVEIRKVQTLPQAPAPVTTSTSWPLSTWFGALVVLALPVVTWSLTMRHLKTTQPTAAETALPDNVTPLPTREAKKPADDIKKAS